MSRPGALSWACLLGALVLPAPAIGAQEEHPPAPEAAPDDPEAGSVWYAWVEQDELSSILEVCTLVVGAHIEYDPAALAGQVVRLRFEPAYPGDELWELANRELALRNLTTVQPPGTESFQVVPFAEAVNRARLDPPDLAGVRAGFAKVLLPLEFVDPERAETLLREALTADLFYGPAHNNLGVVFLGRGELYEAAQEFEWARKLLPASEGPRINLALVLERAGRWDDALDAYEGALAVAPESVAAMQGRSALAVERGLWNAELADHLRQLATDGETAEWRDWARATLSRAGS